MIGNDKYDELNAAFMYYTVANTVPLQVLSFRACGMMTMVGGKCVLINIGWVQSRAEGPEPVAVLLQELMMDAMILAKLSGHDVFNALDLLQNVEFLRVRARRATIRPQVQGNSEP